MDTHTHLPRAPQPLLAFAFQVYNHPPLQHACLELQNSYQANVLFLLWFCWAHWQGIVLTKTRFTQAQNLQAQIAGKHLQQFRALRQRLKQVQALSPSEYTTAKKVLLEAEIKLECQVLKALDNLSHKPENQAAAGEEVMTLTDYLSCIGIAQAQEQALFLQGACASVLTRRT